MKNERAVQVSNTIIDQLGGNGFIAMTGSKEFAYTVKPNGDISLSFRVGKNVKRVSHIRVTLNGQDLYDIEFARISILGDVKILNEMKSVYAEDLQELFVNNTGLLINL